MPCRTNSPLLKFNQVRQKNQDETSRSFYLLCAEIIVQKEAQLRWMNSPKQTIRPTDNLMSLHVPRLAFFRSKGLAHPLCAQKSTNSAVGPRDASNPH
mmetsp:Transcript_22282/g.61907  ORF Transcript_22282/g.61907 Transcript_22282/m.61907 type:complete len:98 (-) Transcript_22282:1082-1375(-)